jgi:hypothetical protein
MFYVCTCFAVEVRRRWEVRVSLRAHPVPRVPWLFMLPRDISLFIQGARTDAKIARLQRDEGTRAAFETVYTESADPWASASPRYRYQGLKYDN